MRNRNIKNILEYCTTSLQLQRGMLRNQDLSNRTDLQLFDHAEEIYITNDVKANTELEFIIARSCHVHLDNLISRKLILMCTYSFQNRNNLPQ